MVKDIYKHLPPTPPQVLLSIEPMFGFLREEQLRDTEHLVAHLASMLSVPRKSVYRWMKDGVTLHHAESLAHRIGLHPASVWGPEYHIAVYMDEMRDKVIDNIRLKKLVIRRSIQNKEKKLLKAQNGKV